MRRSASEVIRNLEMRVARLEKQAHQKIAVDGTDYYTLTTAYDDELQSYNSLSSALEGVRNPEVMSLKVFLKCLSLKRANNLALKLSKKLNIKGWENDREVLTYALMLKTKYGTKGIGRVFTMIAEFLGLKKLERVLKRVRLLTPLYEHDDFASLWNLMLGSNGVSLKVFDNADVKVEDHPKMIEEGEVGVANYGGADIYGTELDLLMEENGTFTIPLGVNEKQVNQHLVDRFNELLEEAIDDAIDGQTSHTEIEDFVYYLGEEHGSEAEVSCSAEWYGDKIVGSFTVTYTQTVNARDYYESFIDYSDY